MSFRRAYLKPHALNKRDADIDFDAHFLRWMLSDGAGGAALSNKPASSGLSLKINWILQK